jgi:hypothetical protein
MRCSPTTSDYSPPIGDIFMRLTSLICNLTLFFLITGCGKSTFSVEWQVEHPDSARAQVEACKYIDGVGKSADAIAFPELCSNATIAVGIIDAQKTK